MNERFVLMYHRVCERDARTRCWFERGTAVTPAALDRHLTWLTQHVDVVPLEALAEPAPSSVPRAAITFDDGYADVLSVAAPLCARHGLAATCFASTGPALRGSSLWFDAWYTIVAAGIDRAEWPRLVDKLGLPPARDLASCVLGPPKRWLATLAPLARDDLLSKLADALDVRLPRQLYLDGDDLRRLHRSGWRIGGHGVEHCRLTDGDPLTVERELAESRDMITAVADAAPLLFAYPDGAWNDDVVAATGRAGFALACTTERGPWRSSIPALRVPRLFCRGNEFLPHPDLAGAVSA